VLLSSPCGLLLPKWSGHWRLASGGSVGALLASPFHLMWSGNFMHGLGLWRSESFASSWWFFLLGVSPASLQDFTLGGMLSASSL
jgi:hypothetical protein